MLLANAMAALLAGVAPCSINCGTVEYEQKSWGRPIYRFVLKPDGEFESWTFDFPGSQETHHSKIRLRPPQHRDARLALQVLAKGSSVTCRNGPTDLPYGTYKWSSGQRLHVYYGCYLKPETKRIAAARDAEDRLWRAVGRHR